MKKINSVNRYLFVIILLSEIILAFSTLGYIVIEPLSITFMYVPVLVCAFLYGPRGGAAAGAVFGITSMWKAGVTATAYADLIFSPFVSGKPWDSMILSVGTRLAFGILSGYLFCGAKQMKRYRILGIAAAAVAAKLLHSVLVYGCMQLLFQETGAMVRNAFISFIKPKNIVENMISAGIVVLADSFVRSKSYKILSEKAEFLIHHYKGQGHRKIFIIFAVILLFILNTLFLHLYGRIQSVFQINGLVLSENVENRLFQIFLQFQTAMAALITIFCIFVMLIIKYSISLAAKSKKDLMTGVYNRASVIEDINDRLLFKGGYLIMADIDDFKMINDTYGHPFGDYILIETAKILEGHFGKKKLIGRLGGDEFCIFVEDFMEEEELIRHLERVGTEIGQLKNRDDGIVGVSLSIGIAKAAIGEDFLPLYQKTDSALYKVKKEQKNNFAFYREE